jgi:hypothetical protein
MHADLWSIFTAVGLFVEMIPALVILTLVLETQKD